MTVGSIEIKQVQRTINNDAVAEAEQVQVRGRYTSWQSRRKPE